MTQRFSFWEDLSIAENLDFVARMYGVKDRRAAVRESIEQLGLAGAAKATGRPALGRLEATPGARRLPDPPAQAAAARRTDRGRRSQGAPGLLGANPSARRARD